MISEEKSDRHLWGLKLKNISVEKIDKNLFLPHFNTIPWSLNSFSKEPPEKEKIFISNFFTFLIKYNNCSSVPPTFKQLMINIIFFIFFLPSTQTTFETLKNSKEGTANFFFYFCAQPINFHNNLN